MHRRRVVGAGSLREVAGCMRLLVGTRRVESGLAVDCGKVRMMGRMFVGWVDDHLFLPHGILVLGTCRCRRRLGGQQERKKSLQKLELLIKRPK